MERNLSGMHKAHGEISDKFNISLTTCSLNKANSFDKYCK